MWAIARASAGGGWSEQPGRLVLAVLGIAFGVALGAAVHLINASAANEFDLAVRSLSGEADVVVRSARAGFPDTLYPQLARAAGVRAASPALEVDARLAGRRETLRVIGLDPLRAGEVQPHLLSNNRDAVLELLEGDSALLSATAAQTLGLAAGDVLRVQSGSGTVDFRVGGVLPADATRERLAIVDIAAAQWRFARLGELSRIDLKLAAGTEVGRFRAALAPLLPPGVVASTPDVEAARSASFTRAYRINLDMLALVALFTGGFLVFSTQFLALLRRRTQLALLRVLGLTRRKLVLLLVVEGAALGVVGAALGVALGVALAQFGLARAGGDLGAGYFRGLAPTLVLTPPALAAYFALGVAFAVAGAALPAFEAARRPPALALRAGDEEAALRSLRSAWPGAGLVGAGLALSQAPPVHGLPLFGYLAVALMLVGGILLMPSVARVALARVPPLRAAPLALAAAQLQATPRQAGVSLAAILASFSLMVSMLIMIGSFRDSLERWLDAMLPAELYVRAGRTGEAGFFTPEEQRQMAVTEGVGSAQFLRSQSVLLRADRPALTLLAREFRDGRPAVALPLEGAEVQPARGAPPPAWISEIAADMLDKRAGDTLELPLGARLRAFTVAGVWRDYARQNGAIVIPHAVYLEATGDARANEAHIELAPGANFNTVARRLSSGFADPDALEIASAAELKAASLSIFDRTFAVTYALEAAAVLIGLFGVSASFSAQALARRREFGVLRHLGMRRRDIGAMLAAEGVVVGTLGVAAGLALGWLISLVLVHVINRQSFHWSMDMSIPWTQLAALSALLIAAASATAVLGGRRAMSNEVTRAVREDW